MVAVRGALADSSSVYEFSDTDAELDRAEALAQEALSPDDTNAHAHLVGSGG